VTPAELLRDARLAAQLTQAQLAQRLGTTQPVVARLERADSNPTWQTLARSLRAAGYGLQLVPLEEPAAEVDLGQLRERLAMSPAERLRVFQESQQLTDGLRRRARRDRR
jgi:transcriptional regulator with XRE-family HTH domain